MNLQKREGVIIGVHSSNKDGTAILDKHGKPQYNIVVKDEELSEKFGETIVYYAFRPMDGVDDLLKAFETEEIEGLVGCKVNVSLRAYILKP